MFTISRDQLIEGKEMIAYNICRPLRWHLNIEFIVHVEFPLGILKLILDEFVMIA